MFINVILFFKLRYDLSYYAIDLDNQTEMTLSQLNILEVFSSQIKYLDETIRAISILTNLIIIKLLIF